jgi:hypothetical protein
MEGVLEVWSRGGCLGARVSGMGVAGHGWVVLYKKKVLSERWPGLVLTEAKKGSRKGNPNCF